MDNIASITGINHWPVRRENHEDWKAMKSKTRKQCMCLAKGRLTRSGKHIKTTWVCNGCLGEPGHCVEKECFELYHTQFDFSV